MHSLAFTETPAFYAAFLSYFTSNTLYFAHARSGTQPAGKFATRLAIVGVLFHLWFLIMRATISGRAPWSNQFEAVSFLTFSMVIVYLVVEWQFGTRSIGVIALGMAFALMAIAMLLPSEIRPLPPALKSYWIKIHVSMTLIGYGFFGVAYASGLAFLFKDHETTGGGSYFGSVIFPASNVGLIGGVVMFHLLYKPLGATLSLVDLFMFKATVTSIDAILMAIFVLTFVGVTALVASNRKAIAAVLPSSDFLDEITYKVIGVGLPVFTLGGLILGAAWAQYAWGAYWSWDPKETWALIVFLVYLVYLHARLQAGWVGRKSVLIAVAGFGVTLFCFFGVNFLLSGLHTYAKP